MKLKKSKELQIKTATINIFNSAFDNGCETVAVETGKAIKDVLVKDFENAIIFCNGKKIDENYILQDGDICTMRLFPKGGGKALDVLGWIFDPIGSAISAIITQEGHSSWYQVTKKITEMFAPDVDSGASVGKTGDIPCVRGGKNKSGANQVIPLLLGESFYTPILLANTYTSIDPTDGTDGENQYFHGLYCLGYNDIDLKKVQLGIYDLSIDECNGTSKNELYVGTMDRQVNYKTDSAVVYNETYIGKDGKKERFSLVSELFVTCNSGFAIKDLRVELNKTDIECVYLPPKFSNSHWVDVSNVSLERITYEKQNDNKYRVVIEWKLSHKMTYPIAEWLAYYMSVDYSTYEVTYTLSKLNENFIKHYDPTKYHQRLELQQNGAEVGLYPYKITEERFDAEMLHPQGADALILRPFSAMYPAKIELEFMLGNLVRYDDSNNQCDETIEFGVQYSLDGGKTWADFNCLQGFTYNGGHRNQSNTITQEVLTGQTTNIDGIDITTRIFRLTGHKNKKMRFVSSMDFSFNDLFNVSSKTKTDDGGNPVLDANGNQIYENVAESKVKNNTIEFRIWRQNESLTESDSKHQYQMYFSAIRTWTYDYDKTTALANITGPRQVIYQRPIIEKYRNMTARLGFTIKGGDEISNTLDELNVEMMSRARTCKKVITSDGDVQYEWTGENETSPTNNPASLAIMVMQHQSRGRYKYSDDLIDWDSFGEFYFWCQQTDRYLDLYNAQKYVCNGVVSKEFKTNDLVNNILSCGHGKLILRNGKYAVFCDKTQTMPIMVLNNQNILEASNTKTFNEDIDGYSVKFINALNDYQEDTIVCVDKDAKEHKNSSEWKLENLELPFVTDATRVYRECMYRLACRRLRPETWSRKVGIEGNLLEIGNLVEIQDDTLLIGIGNGAEITRIIKNANETEITGIEVDFPFVISDNTKNYGVTIQQANGTSNIKVMTYPVTEKSVGSHKILTFDKDKIEGSATDDYVLKIQDASRLQISVGDIVAFGIFDKITTKATVSSKKGNSDGTFSLTLIPYIDDIYSSDIVRGDIPEFQTNVTPPKQNGNIIDTGAEISRVSMQLIKENAEPMMPPLPLSSVSAIARKNGVNIHCEPDTSGIGLYKTIKTVEYELSKDNGASWENIGKSGCDIVWTFNRTKDGYPERDDFASWKVRAKPKNIYDLEPTENKWTVSTVEVASDYGTWHFPTISNVKADVDKDGITIKANFDTSRASNLSALVVHYAISKNGGDWESLNSNRYNFKRGNSDKTQNEYLEKNDLQSWQVKVWYEDTETGKTNDAVIHTIDSVDLVNYGTWTIPLVNTVTAKAEKDRIVLNANNSIPNDNYNAPYLTVKYAIKKSESGEWEATNNIYEFIRTGDNKEYLEASDIQTWRVKAWYKSSETGNEGDAKEALIDTSGYGTWEVSAPIVGVRVSGRTVNLYMSQPARGDGRERYSTIKHRVQVKRLQVNETDTDYDTAYYKPNLGADPYGDETNYKTDSTTEFEVCDDFYSQIMPLYNQDQMINDKPAPAPVDTRYRFEVIAHSVETGKNSKATETADNGTSCAIARATAARDVVDSAITTNKLAPDCVTFDKIHALDATAEQGSFGDLATKNFIVGKVSGSKIAADSDNYWDLQSGEFRVGNSIDSYENTDEKSTSYMEPKDNNASYIHLKNVGDIWKLVIATSKIVISSLATAVRGIFKVQTDAKTPTDFMVVDPGNAKKVTVSGNITANSATVGASNSTAQNLTVNGISKVRTASSDFIIANPTTSDIKDSQNNVLCSKQTLKVNGTLEASKIINSSKTIDLSASTYDQNTWYPVTTDLNKNKYTTIKVETILNSGTKPSWSTHNSGFSVAMTVTTIGCGWGCLNYFLTTIRYDQNWTNDNSINCVGWSQLREPSLGILWLRGGGKYYVNSTDDYEWIIRTSTYKPLGSSNQTCAPTTSMPPLQGNIVIYNNFLQKCLVVPTASQLQTARNISISDGTNTGTAVSFDGTSAVTLKLPTTIKATLKGNADYATNAGNASSANNAYHSTIADSADSAKYATNAGQANKIRVGRPTDPQNGDIWIEV